MTGDGSVTWTEIDTWCARTGLEPDEFECGMLVTLSREYLSMYRAAMKRDCPPPFVVKRSAPELKDFSNKLRGILRAAAPKERK